MQGWPKRTYQRLPNLFACSFGRCHHGTSGALQNKVWLSTDDRERKICTIQDDLEKYNSFFKILWMFPAQTWMYVYINVAFLLPTLQKSVMKLIVHLKINCVLESRKYGRLFCNQLKFRSEVWCWGFETGKAVIWHHLKEHWTWMCSPMYLQLGEWVSLRPCSQMLSTKMDLEGWGIKWTCI